MRHSLVAAVIVLAGCGGDDERGEVAYSVIRDDVPTRIIVVEDDGTNARRVSGARQGASPVLPTWSPDARRIAFVRFNPRGGPQSLQVYVVNADGTRERHLGEGTLPRWIRGREAVVVERPRLPPAESTLHVLSLDGSSRRLTAGSSPAVSRDGARVAFVRHTYARRRDGSAVRARSSLFTIGVDGSGLRRIARSARNTYFVEPAWRPGRSEVTVIERALGAEGRLYSFSRSGARRVLARGVGETYDWAPDGDLIAYTGGTMLRVIRPDGTRVAAYSQSIAIDIDWAPDGRWLAFSMMESATGAVPQVGLYRVDVEEGEPDRFVFSDGFAAYLDWRPDEDG